MSEYNLEKVLKPRGKPRSFENADVFYDAVREYLTLCETEFRMIPTVTGFCVWYGITRETYYKQQEYYSDTFKKVEDMFEVALVNCRHFSDARVIFTLKNKFKWSDRVESAVTHENPLEIKMNLSELSNEELKEFARLSAKVKPK